MAHRAHSVKQIIITLLLKGHVVMTYKAKSLRRGGYQLFSVGPYATACGAPQFAVIDKFDCKETIDAGRAAQQFIDLVGYNLAKSAAQKSLAERD